jgi:integrase/recombinase XerD
MLTKKAISEYLEWKGTFAVRASQNYKRPIEQFFAFISKGIGDVEFQDIVRFQLHIQKIQEDTTSALWVTAVRDFFGYCKRRGITTLDVSDIKNPKVVEKIPTYVVQTEFENLCDIAKNEPIKLLALRLLWFTGIRVSELCDIQVKDLDLSECCARIQTRKAFRPKLIMWDEETNNLMLEVLATRKGNHLFGTRSGDGISPRQVQRWIKELCKRVGITKDITPHSFRHGFAHQSLDSGMDLPALQALLGHKNPKSLFKYTRRLDEDVKEKAREVLRKRIGQAKFKELEKLFK